MAVRKIDAYFNAVKSGDIAAIDDFLDKNNVKPMGQIRALKMAIRRGKSAVVDYLLNVKLDAKGRNLFTQQESHEVLGWALARGHYKMAELPLSHLKKINDTSYKLILSHINHNSQPSTAPASSLDALNRFIALLFKHPGLEKYPTFHLDTFRTLCLKHGLAHVYKTLSKDGFLLPQQPQEIQFSILFSLMESMHSLSLVQHIPELDDMLKVNIQIVSDHHENLLLTASKHNNVNMMQYLVSLEPSLLNFMQFSPDPLYDKHNHEKNILMATADSHLPAPQAIQWLLSKGLTDHGLLIKALTRNPNQIEMLEAYIAGLPSENVESLVALSRETPCLLEDILLGQTSDLFNSFSLRTEAKKRIRLRAVYALTNKLLEATEDKHPSKTHLAARFNQDNDIPFTKFVITPTKPRGSRSLGTIQSLLFNRQTLGTTHRRMAIEGPGSVDCHGKTPLHYLAMNAPFQTLQMIKAKVENLNHHPHQDRLKKAVKNIDTAMSDVYDEYYQNNSSVALEKLIKSGTPINAKDRDGNTALHIAAQYHDANIVNWLCKAGATVNERNNAGVTPLMLACRYNYYLVNHEQPFGYDTVNALLSHNADPLAQDHAGNNCYDYLNKRIGLDDEEIRGLLDMHVNNPQFNFVW